MEGRAQGQDRRPQHLDPAAAGFTVPALKLAVKNNDEWVDRFQREVSG
ncbi:hypothetical protein [Streptomyces avermitilis]